MAGRDQRVVDRVGARIVAREIVGRARSRHEVDAKVETGRKQENDRQNRDHTRDRQEYLAKCYEIHRCSFVRFTPEPPDPQPAQTRWSSDLLRFVR